MSSSRRAFDVVLQPDFSVAARPDTAAKNVRTSIGGSTSRTVTLHREFDSPLRWFHFIFIFHFYKNVTVRLWLKLELNFEWKALEWSLMGWHLRSWVGIEPHEKHSVGGKSLERSIYYLLPQILPSSNLGTTRTFNSSESVQSDWKARILSRAKIFYELNQAGSQQASQMEP